MYDNTSPYPSSSTISIETSPNQYTFSDQSCSFALSYSNNSYFYWGQPRSGSFATYERQADPAVSWTVSQTPEYLCHSVFSYDPGPIRAVITVNYWGEQW